MPNLKETKDSIESIGSTRKITRAMYLISASKSKKARKAYERSLPYFKQVAVTLSEILTETEQFGSVYLQGFGKSVTESKLFLIIGAERGLSGGYLHNIIEVMEQNVDRTKDKCWVAGHAGRGKMVGKRFPILPDFEYPVAEPDLYMTREIGGRLVEEYLSGKYASVNMIYSVMINPMTIIPKAAQLLPLKPEDLRGVFDGGANANAAAESSPIGSALFVPSPAEVFEHLVPSYVKGIVYGAFVDAYTSEQNARMIAMDNSTNNATEMLGRLTLAYNRARQAKITQEISEVTGGIPDDR